ncbi:heterokaryon incompatibility protein-domain-containing protein [Rhexocercosporidium sp. MPI-PUGE-AT-0058]|nr:heterokaryon incompatibility protein-domain-containing protein [Rhexocercosporidium sp. MPI-PUGE-AT-0058]
MPKPLVVLEYDGDNLVEDSANESIQYTYEPLPDAHYFRLIELLPGEGTSKLECHITRHLLDDSQRVNYRAISYTWMESQYDNLVISGKRVEFPGPRATHLIQHPIWCEGRRLLISTNLRDALRRFRHPTLLQKFWIDAICINQDDLEERSHQVILMPRIYHLSLAVWFWLGESDEEAGHALCWINKLDQAFSGLTEMPSRLDIYNSTLMLSLGIHPIHSRNWKALVDLFRRPVFQRMWIVQEIVTARKVIAHCGPWSMDYDLIQAVVNFLTRCSWDSELSTYHSEGENFFHCISVVSKIKSEWRDNRHNIRPRLVLATRNFRATDPKDKIFALLGLFNDFAHREACYLGLCDASHRTAASMAESGTDQDRVKIDMSWHENTEWSRAGNAITKALGELIAHQAESKMRELEERHAKILRHSQDEQILSIRIRLVRYLRCCLFQVLREVKAFVGLREDEPVAPEVQQLLDGEDEKYLSTNTESVEFLSNAIQMDTQDGEFRTVQSFIVHVLNTVGEELSKAQELKTSEDVAILWATQLFVCQRRIIHFLQLILFTTATPDDSVDDIADQMNGLATDVQQVPFCSTAHGRPFDHDIGQICILHMHGRYILSTSSCDKDFFIPAMKAAARSTAPPHPGCTMSEDSWRLVKAFVGDLSEWSQETSTLLVRGNLEFGEDGQLSEIPPSAERVLDMGWLNNPFESYLEHEHHPRSRTSPLQHWSWSDDISRMPDYHLQINDVYREFMLRCLHDDPDLLIFSTIEQNSSRMANLPSWVPDFSISISRNLLLFPELGIEIPYTASGDAKVEVSWTPDHPDILKIKGHRIDSIKFLAEPDASEDVFWFVDEIGKLLDGLPDVYPAGGTRDDALWRTFIANSTSAPEYTYPAPQEFSVDVHALRDDKSSRGDSQTSSTAPPPPPPLNEQALSHSVVVQYNLPSHRPPPPSPPRSSESRPPIPPPQDTGIYNEDTESMPEDDRSDSSSDESPENNSRRIYWEAAKRTAAGRRFFVTETGLFGLAPLSALEGDLVCIFAGGRLPYVIRSNQASGDGVAEQPGTLDTYTLVGECYCHGICEGQVLEREDFCWESFLLK